MATLLELCESGRLEQIDATLDGHELAWRRIFATPEFVGWLDETLPAFPTDEVYSNMSPLEQVYSVFAEYISGEDFSIDKRFRKLKRTPTLDIWEIKTSDIRIFGWVPEKDAFICCFGDDASTIKNLNLYDRYMAQANFVRTQIDLNEPKSITGGSYADVLSTKD